MKRIFKIENEKCVVSGIADFSAVVASRGDIRAGEEPEVDIFDLELFDLESETPMPDGDELSALLVEVEKQLLESSIDIAAQVEEEKSQKRFSTIITEKKR